MAVSLGEAKKFIGLESPNFENPPVVETAIGFRFAPIEGFNAIHFGQLFGDYEKHYSRAELKPPLGTGPQIRFNFGTIDTAFSPACRCLYLSEDKTHLVQVQQDAFVRNWRATADCPEYQHYSAIRPLFSRDWLIFLSFLDKHGLKRPEIWQCEMSYINQLVRGKDWNSFEDISTLFPVWSGLETNRVFSSMESASFNVVFKLPDESSRIEFVLQPGIRQDGTEILQLTVSALGQPSSQDNPVLFDWLDFAHLAVVNGFVQFTSAHAHEIWRKK